jgi:hypothetical protein
MVSSGSNVWKMVPGAMLEPLPPSIAPASWRIWAGSR